MFDAIQHVPGDFAAAEFIYGPVGGRAQHGFFYVGHGVVTVMVFCRVRKGTRLQVSKLA